MARESPFWENQTVVVTGGAGFLGSFVVEQLRAKGCRHVVVPRSKDYDLVQMEAVKQLYSDAKPDIVIHLAARVGGIGANQANPGRFFYDNLMMGAQLIEVGRQQGLKKFVATGTICAYPKFAPIPFKEDDIWNGYPEETNAPYGLAKKMMLAQSQAYRDQYGFNSIVLFPVNLYGPRDNFDLETSHVIPALIRKCATAKEEGRSSITLWGDGTPTREFLYVEDAAEGILLAAEQYDESLPVNLGTGEEISIRDLAGLIASEVGFDGHIQWDTTKPNGQPRRCLDVNRAKQLFGFQARYRLRDGLKKTVQWFQANRY
ncbi:MAG: GDP-fucose synthetase, partial [Nitrospira sp. WS110]|nr:GDP-fucose synthetase [Nitrospira sp. WS110]